TVKEYDNTSGRRALLSRALPDHRRANRHDKPVVDIEHSNDAPPRRRGAATSHIENALRDDAEREPRHELQVEEMALVKLQRRHAGEPEHHDGREPRRARVEDARARDCDDDRGKAEWREARNDRSAETIERRDDPPPRPKGRIERRVEKVMRHRANRGENARDEIGGEGASEMPEIASRRLLVFGRSEHDAATLEPQRIAVDDRVGER